MSTPKITDDELTDIIAGPRGMTGSLELRLAQCIVDDRDAFRQLIKNIEPMAQQVISPKDNTFSRQLELIRQRL